MNYRIIEDKDLLMNFIEFLPELERHETYYVCLFARNKYCKDIVHLNSDKQQMRRFTSDKNFLYRKIKQLECEIGSYMQKDTPIPQEALAVYISLNPRDMISATKQSVKKLLDLSLVPYAGHNPHEEVMSELQKANGRKIYMVLDFDNVDMETTIEKAKTMINFDCVKVLQTRGGFHLLVKLSDVSDEYKRTFYKNLISLEGCDYHNDNMIPIPGTYQGGFIPHFIK